MSQRGPGIQRIAVAAAVLAVIVALVGVIIVVRRGHPDVMVSAPKSRSVRAEVLAQLGSATVERASYVHGVHTTDALAFALGLMPGDTLQAISGRTVTSPAELDAVLHQLDALQPSAWFVELALGGAHAGEHVIERWQIEGDLAAARRALPAAPAVDAAGNDPLIATIRQLNARTYEVPRATVETWMSQPARFAAGVTSTASSAIGHGLELQIRPGSAVAALGLQSGDVIRGVNGTAPESPDAAAKAPDPAETLYTVMAARIARSNGPITLDIWRDGQNVMLNYLIR